jgi:YfiH family protein
VIGDAGFRLEEIEGLRVARCGALLRVPGISHVVSTRIPHRREDSEDASERRRALFRAAGFRGSGFALLRQVHGNAIVDATTVRDAAPEADGVFLAPIPAGGGPVPAVRAADCVPILLADSSGRGVAAVHAGWRGTAAGIATRAVEALAARGCAPSGLIAALGPAIGPCCYEVGGEVVDALEATGAPRSRFAATGASGRAHVDLHEANHFQLERAGVPAASIHRAPWCTRCRNDLFFSARAEGATAGRLVAAIGPTVAARLLVD